MNKIQELEAKVQFLTDMQCFFFAALVRDVLDPILDEDFDINSLESFRVHVRSYHRYLQQGGI